MSKTEDSLKNKRDLQPSIPEEEIEIPDIISTEIFLVSDKKKPDFFECSDEFTVFD